MEQAEGILDYPEGAEGFGRRLWDVFRVRWVVPETRSAPEPPLAEVGAWRLPAGMYLLRIEPVDGHADERRVLLGDRRRRRREVDAHSLAFVERRGEGDRRKESQPPSG